MRLWPIVSVLSVVFFPLISSSQLDDGPTQTPTYGNREIDKLPKSGYARPEEYMPWGEDPAEDFELALHLKDHFRVGEAGIERLCVIEARRPEGDERPLRLVLRNADGQELWSVAADWIGPNQRMRPHWLPVWFGSELTLSLDDGLNPLPSVAANLSDGAPRVMWQAVQPPWINPVDAGLALLGADEVVAVRGQGITVRRGVAGGITGETVTRHEHRDAAGEVRGSGRGVMALDGQPQTQVGVWNTLYEYLLTTCTRQVSMGDELLSSSEITTHGLERAPEVDFGARYANLRYTRPVRTADGEKSWDELWQGSEKRDVVVSWPDSVARFVFWRGANYVGCWALPEAWLTYEWLEAEPDFYDARGCVEPLQDKNCEHSEVTIAESTPARVVVRWSYKLVDLDVKWIRGEHAEEIFTFYPDGTGTRLLRAFVEPGWHENQEFIVINRPGRRASDALDPQAITFHSPDGERQAPVWPKPGFGIDRWPQVISVVNIKGGPHPFMVTPDAPRQVKVWADPYIDKPDIFNSYPHWPVTRGIRTTWLDDPAHFGHPTHSNLANLVSDPIREFEGQEDYAWLIGTADKAEEALDAARCWLKPGRIAESPNVAEAQYSQEERAYIVTLRHIAGEDTPEFTLEPEPGVPVVNPAFIVSPVGRRVTGSVEGATRVEAGRTTAGLVVWAEGRFEEPTKVRITGRR